MILLMAAAFFWWRPFEPATVIIRDGQRELIHTTNRQNPNDILAEAGVEPGPEGYLLEGEDGTMVIRLLRQQRITIDYYGKLLEVTSTGETVDQLLSRLKLEGDDLLSVSGDRRTFDGMKLRIARVQWQEETYTAVMPYDTLYCSDPTLPRGTRQVLRQGKNGDLLRRAEVTYLNGIETSRHIRSEQVLRQPVQEVVAVGTGMQQEEEAPQTHPVVGNGIITLPTGEVLTYYRVISSLATAYCDKGKTATGTQARVGAIAVDPDYIPYGTRMFIMSQDGEYIYGIATAEDCGSKDFIYGTRIDLHYNTRYECRQFGARLCWVYILH